MVDRRYCQDYTRLAAKVAAREASYTALDFIKDCGILLLFFGLFILGSSIACPI